ncbi:MAG: YbbR-like domain-containing protein, partial [Eubacterium sp.]|nr:YbbR-like domain-containing protein [Eubacterium sp.]
MANEKKKRKFSFRKLVYNDRYLIACSIIAAIVIWVATSMNLSPETTKKITVPVSVDFSDTLAEQLGIDYYGDRELTVDVTISCKKYLVKEIDENQINASLQTSNVTSTGYLSVPISVSKADDAEFSIDSWFPTSAQGYYDVKQEETLPLELNYTNESFAADGYVVGDVAINQNVVIVSGPRTYMSNVEKVVADITLENGLTESRRIDLQPRAVDENGAAVNYVTVNLPEGENFVATIPILKVQNLQPAVSFVSGPENALSFLDVDYSVNSIQVGALESSDSKTLNLGNISFADLNLGENTFEFEPNKLSGIK